MAAAGLLLVIGRFSSVLNLFALSFFLLASFWAHFTQYSCWFRQDTEKPGSPRSISLLVWCVGFAILLIYTYRLRELPWRFLIDTIRDGPLLAQHIFEYKKGFFESGPYQGFSLIIPTLLIPFELLIPRDPLASRVCSLFVAFLTFALFYRLLRTDFPSPVSALATLSLATTPLTMHLFRDDVVIAFSSLLAIFNLTWLRHATRKVSKLEMARIGLLIGWSFYFLITAAVCSVVTSLLVFSVHVVRSRKELLTLIGNWMSFLFGFVLACIPGYPYFKGFSAGLSERTNFNSDVMSTLTTWWHNYTVTLRGFLYPLMCGLFCPPFCVSLISVTTLFCAFAGILIVLFRRKQKSDRFCLLCTPAILILAFTNSAVTNVVLNGHRLVVVVPFITYAAAPFMRAVYDILGKIRRFKMLATGVTATVCTVILIYPALSFFRKYEKFEEVSTNACGDMLSSLGRTLSDYTYSDSHLCIQASDTALLDCLKPVHTNEMILYFTGIQYDAADLVLDQSLPPRTVKLRLNCLPGIEPSKAFHTIKARYGWTFMIDADYSKKR